MTPCGESWQKREQDGTLAKLDWNGVVCGALAVSYACNSGDDAEPTQTATGIQTATDPTPGTNPNETTGGEPTTGATTGAAFACGKDPALQAACDSLCEHVWATGCDHLEFYVPYVYFLYNDFSVSDPPDPGDLEWCKRHCADEMEWMSGVDQCGASMTAILACLEATGTCNENSNWKSTACGEQIEALNECKEQCIDLSGVGCNPATCNGSYNAGGYFCTWACDGDVCASQCNF